MHFIEDPTHPSNWNRDERNLYIRVFAEFLFSQGPDLDARHSILFACENRLHDDSTLDPTLARVPRPDGELTVTFDNNLHDAVAEVRQGPEYGDVVIWGDTGFITVEAKCATNWSFDKDVAACLESAGRVADSTGRTHLGHVLLIAEGKWQRVRQPPAVNHKKSQYRALTTHLAQTPAPLCVVTWEQIADRARRSLGNAAGSFPGWVDMQVGVCMRGSHAMPPPR